MALSDNYLNVFSIVKSMVSDIEKVMDELKSIKAEIRKIKEMLPYKLTPEEKKLLEESYSKKLLSSKEVSKELRL